MVYCISAVMKKAGALARLERAHHLAGLLNQASAYWLRHTHLRNLAEDGGEFLSINRFAGHSNLETTKNISTLISASSYTLEITPGYSIDCL